YGIDTALMAHAREENRHGALEGEEPVCDGPFVRVLTPQGPGAIAVVGVWGLKALEVVDAGFRPMCGGSLADTAASRLRLGRIGHGLGDEVVVVRQETRTPEVEIHCHGGLAAVGSVLRCLMEAGARRDEDFAIWPGRAGDCLEAQALGDLG